MERYVISDIDIEYLHNTVELVLDIIKKMSPDTDVVMYQQLKEDDEMQVHKLVDRNLSEIEKGTIEHFKYYFNNKRCFALLGDYVIAGLSDENSNNLDELKREAQKKMNSLINTPPDFSTYVMDDRFGLIVMNYEIYGVSAETLSDEEIESNKVNVATALVVRSGCLDTCDAGKIIAICDKEL